MTAVNPQKRNAFVMGLMGLILIVLGFKFTPRFLQAADQQLDMAGKPVILFFNVDEPCECMVELTQRADLQMEKWPVEKRGGISVMRIAMDQQKDLEAKYQVFRAPCLILVDAKDRIVWRQDYPLIEGGPFKLDELEAAIAALRTD